MLYGLWTVQDQQILNFAANGKQEDVTKSSSARSKARPRVIFFARFKGIFKVEGLCS